MNRILCSLMILAISHFDTKAQNNAASFLQLLKKENPDLYSGFKGAFTVGETGAAAYDVPFTVTPGVGGLTPQISVTYNSNGGPSILGEGWSLNGLSFISRTGSLEALDGFTQPVLFTEEDHLQLDGQRIIPLSEEGILGSVYYTENHAFKRISIERNSGVNNINGARLFKVESKDGLEYYYGDLQNMKNLPGLSKVEDDHSNGIVYTRKTGSANIALIWLVTLIRDKNNNWIYFKYNLNHNYYSPDEIYYGGNDLPAIGKIKFNYEWKNRLFGQANPVNWNRVQYMRGEAITMNKPLASIVAYLKVPNSTKERLVREYNFDYWLDPVSNKLHLQQLFQSTIGHLDKDNKATYTKKISDKANAITFEWIKAPNNIDFSETVTYKDPVTLEEDYRVAIADFNGDGFPDKVIHRANGKNVCVSVSINDRTGKFRPHSSVDTFATAVPQQAKAFTGDFNADGANDLLYVSKENDKLCLYTYYSIPSPTAVSFREHVTKDVIPLPAIEMKEINFGVGDLNADGRTDLMVYYLDKEQLLYQGLFFFPDSLHIGQSRVHSRGNIPADSYISQATDLNGDGVTDLIFTWTDDKGWYIKSFMFQNSEDIGFKDSADNGDDRSPLYQRGLELKLPAGISYADIVRKLESGEWNQKQIDSLIEKGANQTVADGDYTKLNNIMTADINKDGNMDLVISYTDLDGWVYYCALGKGDGTFAFQSKMILTDKIKFLYNHKSSFGDFNGDGNLDLIIQKTDAEGWQQMIAFGDGQGKFRLPNADGGFESLIKKNFTYSQRYVTDYVMPYCGSIIYGLNRIFDDGRIKKIISCEGMSPHACLTKNIRRTFPVETGFYPHREQRPYQTVMLDPINNFIQRNLNSENNIKRIVDVEYTNDSIKPRGDLFCGDSYPYYTKLTYGDYWQPYVVDLNGDGTSDLLLTYPRQIPNDTILRLGTNDLEEGLYVFTVLNKHTKNGFIGEIAHSNKSKIRLEYKSIMVAGETPFTPTPSKYPFLACHAPIYILSKVGTTNGLAENTFNFTSYQYFNGIVGLTGRGFAGFEQVRVTNLQNKNHTDKRYWVVDTFLAYGMMPLRSTETYVHGVASPISVEQYEHTIVKHASVDNVFNAYNIKKSSSTFDLTGEHTSYNDGIFAYDEWGNLIRSFTRRGLGQDEILTTVTNTYFETTDAGWVNEDNWLLGRLKTTEIVTTRGSRTTKRKSAFSYDNTTGQLIKEVSDVDAVASKLSLTKRYWHNKYGNIEESTIFPTYDNNPDLIKKTVTSYSSDNRFVDTIVDPGGYQSVKFTDPLLGLITQTGFGDKDNWSSTIPDEFGRAQRTISADGLELRRELRICKKVDSALAATYFSIETSNLSNFNLPTVTYFDNNGRVVRKLQFDYKYRKIITDFTYDSHGNLASSTYPHFKRQQAYVTTFQYDKINRKILTTLPDSSRLAVSYNGLCEVAVNDKMQHSTSVKNTLGELILSMDNDSFSVAYAYDEFSRVVSIQDKDNRTYKIEYDLNGNRTSYLNPNFSKPELATFDAFGRKIRSVCPMDWEKTFQYDKLDRLRLENANRPGSKHEYNYTYIQQGDTEAGKGKLRTITSDADDHPFNERYTYNAQGQLLTRTYEIRKGSWMYEKNKFFESKNTLTLDFGYARGQLSRMVYPSTGVDNDKHRMTVQYTYSDGVLVAATGSIDKKSIPFWRLQETNAQGTATAYQLGDSIVANQIFDPVINNITMMGYIVGKDTVAGMRYGYDELGNLVMRQDLVNASLVDSIYYDKLNRVINVVSNGYATSVAYHKNGDILRKQFGMEYRLDFDYKPGSSRYNAITLSIPGATTAKITQTVRYDAYGNQDVASFPYLFDGKTRVNIEYNQFNLPYQVGNTRFFYAYDGSRAALYNDASNEGNIFLGNITEYKHDLDYKDILRYQKMNILVNGTVVANYYSDNGQVQFLLKDAQHSVIAVADIKGNILDRYAYDIWGLRRNSLDWKYVWKELKNAHVDPDKRGYLNNISLEGYGLTDMNARLYDPVIGRFIAVDPITSNLMARTQFANPYHYGYNNPTAFIDADGKFGFLAIIAIGAFIGASAAGGSLLPWEWNENWWKGALVGGLSAAGGYFAAPAVFTTGATVTPGMIFASGAAAGFAGGFTSTLVNGGNFIQAFENGLKGGIVGGITATITFGIGETFGNGNSFLSGNYFAKASLHGINQGIASEAMGGSFEHGFLAGSFTSLATPLTQMRNTTPAQRTVISAMVGGTASSLGGGKFANGAVSGAMVQIYNENQMHPNTEDKGKIRVCTPDESICFEGAYQFGSLAQVSSDGELGFSYYGVVGGGISQDMTKLNARNWDTFTSTFRPTVSLGVGFGWEMGGYKSFVLPGGSFGINMGAKNGLFLSIGGFSQGVQGTVNFNFTNMMNTGARAIGELNRQFENWVLRSYPSIGR